MRDLLFSFSLLMVSCGPVNQMCHNNTDLYMVCSDVFGYDYEGKELDQNQTNRLNSIDERINELESTSQTQAQLLTTLSTNLTLLQAQVDNNEVSINTLNNSLLLLDASINASILSLQTNTNNSLTSLQNSLNALQGVYNSLSGTVTTNTQDISAIQNALQNLTQPTTGIIPILQSNINSNTVNIAILQGYHHITEMVDPCGDHPTKADEIFLRLNDGTLVASFSDNASGLNTRFSALIPSDSSTYVTTDGTSCTFKVPATGVNSGKVCWGSGFNTCQ